MNLNVKPKSNALNLLPSLVLCLCLSTSYYSITLAYQLAKKEQQQNFQTRATEIELLIKQRLQAYAQVLYGGSGLFVASEKVSRAEFKSYIRELRIEKFFPGIQGVGFAALIPAADKQKHLAEIRSEGFPNYEIRPSGERNFYTSVIYLEPFSKRNLRAFGFDMYSEQVRRTAMTQAWQENTLSISGKVKLVQETRVDTQNGFLMYVPLYRKNVNITDSTVRANNLLGWIYAPFRMNDFMQAVLNKKPDVKLDIDVDIYDGKTITPEALFYDGDKTNSSLITPVFSTIKVVQFAGHFWTLDIHASPIFEQQLHLKKVHLTAAISLAISLMLTLISCLLVNGRKQAFVLAQQISAELMEKEMRYQQMFEGSCSISLLIDPENSHIIDANPAASSFWGYSIEQLRSMSLTQINTMSVKQLLPLLQMSSQYSQYLCSQHRLKSGEIKEVEIYANPLIYQGRMVVHAIVHDITERKRAEIALRENEEILRGITDSTNTVIFIKDVTGKFIFVNRQFEELFHVNNAVFRGKTADEIFPHDLAETFTRDDQHVIQSGQPLTIEESVANDDGIHTYITVKFPIRKISGEIYAVCGIATDITERKKMEQEIRRLSDSELNKAKLEAEKANRAKSEFLSSMSHELRTPMNAVLGFAQLLALEDLIDEQHDAVQHILTGGYHLMDLINEVLDLAKIESEKLELTLEQVEVKPLVLNCLTLVQSLIAKNNILVIDDICTDCHGLVVVDTLRFKQVMLNLISNAIKYNRPNGSVTISCTEMSSEILRVNVTDTGQGLSEAELAKLFQPFERLSAKSSAVEGTGIGLVISKKLIEAMNGRIGVSSEIGVGSCFWIEIPLAIS